MSTYKKIEPISIDDYLTVEERSEVRHEYFHGAIEAMVGGTARHNQITIAISTILREHLKGRDCTVFMSDMKVRVQDVFYYPDLMVICSPVDPNSLFQSDPVLIVEVLSKSTEKKDRLEKLVAYQSISTVSEYVLVSQDKVAIDIYRRDKDNWQLESLGYGDTLQLSSINYNAPIENLYEDVIGTFS